MGDPKFSRRKYDTPSHPWQAVRITEENEILKKFGLKSKTEVWKAQSYLRRLRRQARELQARIRTKDPQAEKENKNLIMRVANLAMLPEDAGLDDILALNIEVVLGRRLQTLVYQKGLAGTLTQARQMIVHGHVGVGGRKVRIPGYLVTKMESEGIAYGEGSPYTSELHPMRPKLEPKPETPAEAPKPAVDPEKEKQKAKIEELAKKGEQIEHGG